MSSPKLHSAPLIDGLISTKSFRPQSHTHTRTHTHTHSVPQGLSVYQHGGPSLRHVSTASQFCLFKDQAVLLGKWFWRRARSTHISKSLGSHQNRCNFISSSTSTTSSSSIRLGSLSLWPAILHSNNSAKWDRAHELCCFSSTFLCCPVRLAPGLDYRLTPAEYRHSHAQHTHTQQRKHAEEEEEAKKEDERSIHLVSLPSKYQILMSVFHNYFTCFK